MAKIPLWTAMFTLSLVVFYTTAAMSQPTGDTSEAPSFIVIKESQSIDAEGHKTIVRRVEPPVPQTNPTSGPAVTTPSDSGGENVKPTAVLSVSCTVYHRGGEPVTELRWGSQREYHAFSNIDFLDLAGTGDFETADARYCLILGVGKGEAAKRQTNETPLPETAAFIGSHAQYLLFQNASSTGNAADPLLAAMDALHSFYDANKAYLKQKRLERDAENLRLQQEAILKSQQPRPDTIIHFWPVATPPSAAQD